ncbi:hypothetical protein PR202_gb17280 [Eleusine coracana subsp. coracana]|uniref:Uncharacterized protein n=1 Tax=Eleusine coracana subsp. coracana TaxID=191504 RepID=A0AAV5F1Z8_ELECO|nr:hypothetical protein PR202_gb17280 [Eleusine coracana subsp. coracana]
MAIAREARGRAVALDLEPINAVARVSTEEANFFRLLGADACPLLKAIEASESCCCCVYLLRGTGRKLMATMGAMFLLGGVAQDISFAPYSSKHWKELRQLCATELLSPKRVLSYRPITEEEAVRLITAVAASSSTPPVYITLMIKVMMNDILMRCAIGGTIPMRDKYIEALDKGLKFLAGVQPHQPVPSIAARTDARQRLPSGGNGAAQQDGRLHASHHPGPLNQEGYYHDK